MPAFASIVFYHPYKNVGNTCSLCKVQKPKHLVLLQTPNLYLAFHSTPSDRQVLQSMERERERERERGA
jgi:hypothetical protein